MSTYAQIQTATEAELTTLVESVTLYADQHQFEALEALYADEVMVDYTSLSGGEVEVKSLQALMTQWANVLPGFDRTRHTLSNVEVNVTGSTASATADVSADHFVGDLHWQVVGRYAYQFENDGEKWRITHHTFLLEHESGTREVFGPAMEAAKANPTAYIVRQQTAAVVRNLLTALETKDMAQFASFWAEDAVQEMPYSPAGFPKQVSGKANLLAHYASWPEVSGAADFTSALVLHPMQDPQRVFAEFEGEVEVVSTGRTYQQVYGGLFHVEGGQITLFREYYDPAPFAYAFGLNDQ